MMAGVPAGRRRLPCWWRDASSRGVAGLLLHAGRVGADGVADAGSRRALPSLHRDGHQRAGGRWRSWLCAVPDVVAGGGPPAARAVRRESAAGQFADAYADLRARAVIFPDVPDAVRALAATSGSQWSPTPIMTT